MKVELGKQAQAYLNASLRGMVGQLSHDVLAKIHFQEGSIYTWINSSQDDESIRNLSPHELATGGHMDREESIQYLTLFIYNKLQLDNRMCLFENQLARPGDAWLSRCRSHILTTGNEVYHVVHSGEAEIASIRVTIEEASNDSLLGVIVSMPDCAWPPSTGLSASFVSEIVSHLVSVIVGAFDGEGFIVWDHDQLQS